MENTELNKQPNQYLIAMRWFTGLKHGKQLRLLSKYKKPIYDKDIHSGYYVSYADALHIYQSETSQAVTPDLSGWSNYCPDCKATVKVNIQGDIIDGHVCKTPEKSIRIPLEKIDGSATYTGTPSPELVNLVNEMAEKAYEMVISESVEQAAEKIYNKMIDEMPFRPSTSVKPYVIEAIKLGAKWQSEQSQLTEDVRELVEALDGLVCDVGNLLSEHDIEWQQAGYYNHAKQLLTKHKK